MEPRRFSARLQDGDAAPSTLTPRDGPCPFARWRQPGRKHASRRRTRHVPTLKMASPAKPHAGAQLAYWLKLCDMTPPFLPSPVSTGRFRLEPRRTATFSNGRLPFLLAPPLKRPPSHWEAVAGPCGARPASSPWREPIGRARGGRVRASPPFCESITRSRWVGSCYSGASTPSPAGLFCVQWTGEYSFCAVPDDLLALQLSSRRPPGLLGAAARASLRLRPGSRAPPGSLPSRGLGCGRGVGCRDWGGGGVRRAVPPGLRRGGPGLAPRSFPASARLAPNARGSRAALPASRPCLARTRQCREPRVNLPAPRTPLRAPRVALPAPRRALAFACAAIRAPVGLCACAVFPAAWTLPSPPHAAGRGAARRRRPPARKGAGPPPPPPAARPLPGYPQRMAARPSRGPGRGPSAPLCSRLRGAPAGGRGNPEAEGRGDRACPQRQCLVSDVRFLAWGRGRSSGKRSSL